MVVVVCSRNADGRWGISDKRAGRNEENSGLELL